MDLVFALIIIPLLICVALIAIIILALHAVTGTCVKNKDAREIIRGLLYMAVAAALFYALSQGVFSPKLGPWH